MQAHASDVSVVIPCYNEAAGLPALFRRLAPLETLGWELIFVDDDSPDDTFARLMAEAARRQRMRVLRHAVNLGLGAALRTGFSNASAPIICTIDSACTYPPERLPELVHLIEGGADIATASAWHSDAGAAHGKPVGILLSRAVAGCYKVLSGQGAHTFTCPFRAYRRQALEGMRFRADGVASVAEIMLRGMFSGLRVSEMPMRFEPQRFDEAHLKGGDA
jgi:dolichol-phosphate mannosyltransferase